MRRCERVEGGPERSHTEIAVLSDVAHRLFHDLSLRLALGQDAGWAKVRGPATSIAACACFVGEKLRMPLPRSTT
jgi:hypothetical protein